MKKITLIIINIVLIVTAIIFLKRMKTSPTDAAYAIGILQTASHPALDAACNGFIEELKNKMGNNVAFIVHNAQGSIAQAHAIAQQFHAHKRYDAFFVIATPAAQAMSAIEKRRPIIIAAVTDPDALGLITPMTNVCGVKDMIDVKAEIEMLVQLVPSAKRIGLLYTSGETNSVALVEKMRQELENEQLTPIDFAVSNESDIHAMVALACRKTDLILAPTDNTVASAIITITAITRKHKKPLLVSDNMLVSYGALAARGIDYKASGKRAAHIAYQVLIEGKKPYELPIEQAKSEQIVINQTVLTEIGLTVSETIKKYSQFIS